MLPRVLVRCVAIKLFSIREKFDKALRITPRPGGSLKVVGECQMSAYRKHSATGLNKRAD
jgi:hypothetical protein